MLPTQLTLFPDHAPNLPSYPPLGPIAIGVTAEEQCTHCMFSHVRQVILGMGWEHGEEVPVWGFPCCESFCPSCLESTTDGLCERCESCESCCDCFHCDGCYEAVESLEDCGYCRDCCDHIDCEDCGNHTDEYCGDCMCCYRCCCCESEDSEDYWLSDMVVDLTYNEGLLKTGTRTFGVELEHIGLSIRKAAAALQAAGLPATAMGYSHRVMDHWKTVTDASVYRGCEAVSPILRGADGFYQLDVAMSALRANGGSVDPSCGTHVHIGCKDLSADDLVKVQEYYDAHHDLIDMLHAPSRRGNSDWAGPFSPHDKDRLSQACKSSDHKRALDGLQSMRYRSVNLAAFGKYETIEFRQHAGTLNYRKLSAWINFLFALIDAAINNERHCVSLVGLLGVLEQHGLTLEDSGYLSERAHLLASANYPLVRED